MEEFPLDVVRKIMRYVSHPVADLLLSKFDEYEYARCVECDQCRSGGEDPCTCPVLNTSKAEDLYLVTDPSYKLEKILELKVVMNQLESQMGIYSCAKLLHNQNQRLDYVNRRTPEIKQYHPVFWHCNQDLITTCLVMIIRNINFELGNYDDLYDQFY
jgi:hypothetical protein